MKVLREKIKELQYWSYGGKAQHGMRYKCSVYNYIGSPETYNRALSYIGCVLYNIYTNALAVLTKEEYIYFKSTDTFESGTELVERLVKHGFLVPEMMNEYRYMLEETRSGLYLRSRWRQFTILPTQKCNARCFYCFENDVNRIRMSKETANHTVEFILANLADASEFNLDWFGGEPLLEFDRITEMVACIAKRTDIPYTSSITTNAILFDEEKIKTAVEMWHLKRASITIDGLYEEHNKRKAVLGGVDAFTHTMDNIRLLLKNGVYVNLRVHMDNYNKEQLDDILTYLQEFANENFHLFVEKLFMPLQVEDHPNTGRYITGMEVEPFYTDMMRSMKKYGFVDSYADFLSSRRETACMATRRDSILIDCDGYLYKCEQEFYDKKNNVGTIYSGVVYNDHYMNMTVPQIAGTDCESCSFLPACHGGCQFTKALACDKSRACMRGKVLTKLAMPLLMQECDRRDIFD